MSKYSDSHLDAIQSRVGFTPDIQALQFKTVPHCSQNRYTHYLLLITHYLLLITYYSLLITHYLLLITYYSLLITHYLLLGETYHLPVASF
jgi:hypothetical protein